MQVVVFGASGKVGRLVVVDLLADGYNVKAFVHSKNPFGRHKNLKVVRGDIYNATSVEKAVKGSDAVISCLGSWGSKKQNVVSSGTKNVITAMKKCNVRRVITLTGMAFASQDKPKFIDKIGRSILKLGAPKILEDGEKHIKLLEKSGLDWTTLRSPVMTNSTNKSYALNLRLAGFFATIPRNAVAKAMVDQIKSSDYIEQAPVIHRV